MIYGLFLSYNFYQRDYATVCIKAKQSTQNKDPLTILCLLFGQSSAAENAIKSVFGTWMWGKFPHEYSNTYRICYENDLSACVVSSSSELVISTKKWKGKKLLAIILQMTNLNFILIWFKFIEDCSQCSNQYCLWLWLGGEHVITWTSSWPIWFMH